MVENDILRPFTKRSLEACIVHVCTFQYACQYFPGTHRSVESIIMSSAYKSVYKLNLYLNVLSLISE